MKQYADHGLLTRFGNVRRLVNNLCLDIIPETAYCVVTLVMENNLHRSLHITYLTSHDSEPLFFIDRL